MNTLDRQRDGIGATFAGLSVSAGFSSSQPESMAKRKNARSFLSRSFAVIGASFQLSRSSRTFLTSNWLRKWICLPCAHGTSVSLSRIRCSLTPTRPKLFL